MQDNSGVIKTNATLTEIGKKRLLENKFKISKIALSDDGVNYKLLDKNLSNKDILINRLPMLSAWRDSTFNLKNKILVKDKQSYPISDFNATITYEGGQKEVHPKSFKDPINFPVLRKQSNETFLKYYLTDNRISQEKNDIKINIPDEFNGEETVIVRLSESKHFNIWLDPTVSNEKNFPEAYNADDKSKLYSKTVNTNGVKDVATSSEKPYFYLRYRGNFRRDSVDDIYETFIILTGENSGKSVCIRVQILPSEPLSLATEGSDIYQGGTSVSTPPTITNIESGDGKLYVYFNSPLSDGNSTIKEIQYRLNNGAWVTTYKTSSPLIIEGLSNNTTYQVELSAVNDIGRSDPSNSLSSAPSSIPNVPTIDSITSDNDNELTINFTGGSNNGSVITDYEYQIGGKKFKSAGTTTSPIVLQDLLGGRPHHIRIRAINKNGHSPPSNQVTQTPTFTQSVTIDRVNTGDERLFVYYSGVSEKINTIEYRYNDGDWNFIKVDNPVILPFSSTQGTVDVQIRINKSLLSNIVQASLSDQITSFKKYLALDESIRDEVISLTDQMGQSTYIDNIILSNKTGENWEKYVIDGEDYYISPSFLYPIYDHEGYLRLYSSARIPTENTAGSFTGYEINGIQLFRSRDNGSTWEYVRLNGNKNLIDNPNSNFVKFHPMPDGRNIKGDIFSIFLDNNSNSHRYKFTASIENGGYAYGYSENGYEFFPVGEFPDIEGDSSINNIFYDENNENWIIYGRHRGRSARSGETATPFRERRKVIYGYSKNWNDEVYDSYPFKLEDTYSEPDPTDEVSNIAIDPAKSNFYNYWLKNLNETPLIKPDIYMGYIQNYFGYYVGILPVFFKDDNRLVQNGERTTGEIYPVFFYGNVRDSFVLKDQTHPIVDLSPYERVDNLSSSNNQEVGQLYPASSFVNTRDRIYIFCMNRQRIHYEDDLGINTELEDTREVTMQELRLDGFASLNAGGSEGSWTTTAIKIPIYAKELKINSKGTIQVEIINAIDNTPLQGFSKLDSDTISTDSVENIASWNGDSDISSLAGQNCKIKIYVTNGDIYSFWFSEETELLSGEWGNSVYPYALLAEDPTTEYNISWIDDSVTADGSEQEFLYGTSSNNLSNSVKTTGILIPETNSYVYHVKLDALSPDITYYGRIKKSQYEYLDTPTFKTLKSSLSSSDSVKIAFASDLHIDKDDDNSMYNPNDMVQIRDKNPDILALIGDVVSNGYELTGSSGFWYIKFFREHVDILNVNGMIPIFGVAGNHDVGYPSSDFSSDSTINYMDPSRGYFQIFFNNVKDMSPVNENYGQVTVGNYLQLIGLDTFSSEPVDNAQFFQNVVNGSVNYVIPFMHSPLLQGAFRSQADEGLQESLRNNLAELFYNQSNIHAYFTGHMHLRFRSFPWKIIESNTIPSVDYIHVGSNKYMVRDLADRRVKEYGQGYRNSRQPIIDWYTDIADYDEGSNTFNIVTVDNENMYVECYENSGNLLSSEYLDVVQWKQDFQDFNVKGATWTDNTGSPIGGSSDNPSPIKIKWEADNIELKYAQTKYLLSDDGTSRISHPYSYFDVPKNESYLLEYDVYFEEVWNFDTIGQDEDLVKQALIDYQNGVTNEAEADQYITDNGWTFNTDYLDSGFPFVTGKLHGMYPDNPVTGGGTKTDDSWSVRVVWVKNLESHNTISGSDSTKLDNSDGVTLAIYYYGQDRNTGESGKFIPITNWSGIQKNKWYTIKLFVKINDYNQSNAKVDLKIVDRNTGQELGNVSANNLQLHNSQNTDLVKISRLAFNTFHGGSSVRYQPKIEQSWIDEGFTNSNNNVFARFDNFRMLKTDQEVNIAGQLTDPDIFTGIWDYVSMMDDGEDMSIYTTGVSLSANAIHTEPIRDAGAKVIPKIGTFENTDSELTLRTKVNNFIPHFTNLGWEHIQFVNLQDEPFNDGLTTQQMEWIVDEAKSVYPVPSTFTFSRSAILNNHPLPSNIDLAGLNFYPFFKDWDGYRQIITEQEFLDHFNLVVGKIRDQLPNIEIVLTAQTFYSPSGDSNGLYRWRKPPDDSPFWYQRAINQDGGIKGLLHWIWDDPFYFGMKDPTMETLYNNWKIVLNEINTL